MARPSVPTILALTSLAGLAALTSCSREPRSRPYAEIEAEQQARIAAAQQQADLQTASALADLKSIPPDQRDAEAIRRMALLEQALQSSDVSVDGGADHWADADPNAGNPWITPAPQNEPVDAPITQTHAMPETHPAIDAVAPQASIVADAPADAELSEDDRIRLAADPLVRALRDQVNTTDYPVEALLRLASLEAVQTGALPESDISGASPVRTLSDSERTLIEAWRDLHAQSRTEATASDIAAMSRLLTDAADKVRALQPLEIDRAALCTRVERFGVYDELPIYGSGLHKMIAGKPQRVLLYLELANFGHRPDTQGAAEGWSVDLTVGLTLHHLGRQTDLLAWRMSDETVRVFSRNHRREFFLSIVADLPASISVDSYALKAVVRDENSGATAERVIRIDMVADASALVSAAN